MSLVVGDHDNGCSAGGCSLQQLHDDRRVLVIEVAGGLICQYDCWTGYECSRNGQTLTFAAGKRSTRAVGAVSQTHLVEGCSDPPAARVA